MAVLVGRRAGLLTSPVGDIVISYWLRIMPGPIVGGRVGDGSDLSDPTVFTVFPHRVLHGLLSVGDRFTNTCGRFYEFA